LIVFLQTVAASSIAKESPTNEQLEFFESRIRPVLVEQCYSCHNASKAADGSLELDHRAGVLKGGDGGEIVVPGDLKASRLLAILRHEVPGLKMPQEGANLEPKVIADFKKWIAMGAADPRDAPPSSEELENATSWEAVLEKRKRWWSLQPVRTAEPPVAADNSWSDHPVDRFVLAKLQDQDLQPNDPADARALVRRAYFALIGGGTIHGATDELGYFAVEGKCTIYDMWATVLHQLGVNHEELTYCYGGRDFRLTDVHGNVIREILA